MTRLILSACAVLMLMWAPSVRAHDHYTGWKVPGTGGSCCNSYDCDVVTIRYSGGVRFVRWRGAEYLAPDSALLDIPSHDGNSHACVISGVVRCLVIGAGV